MSRSVRLVVLLTLALLSAGTAQAHVGSGSGIAPDGSLYFTDTIRNSIWRLAPDGHLTRIAAGSHTDFLTVDEAGNVYFGHTDGTTTLAAVGGERAWVGPLVVLALALLLTWRIRRRVVRARG